MKNIFKLMAVAMIAVSLPTFTACSDNDDPDNPDNPTQSSFTFNFNNEERTVTDFQAVDHTDEGYLTVFGYETSAQNSCFVQGFLESTVVSGATSQSTGGDIMNYRDPSYTYTDNDGVLGDAGDTYWGWNTVPSSFVENVTAIDLNALTMSANWTAQVFAIEDYIAGGGTPSNLIDFTGNINNMAWTWTSK